MGSAISILRVNERRDKSRTDNLSISENLIWVITLLSALLLQPVDVSRLLPFEVHSEEREATSIRSSISKNGSMTSTICQRTVHIGRSWFSQISSRLSRQTARLPTSVLHSISSWPQWNIVGRNCQLYRTDAFVRQQSEPSLTFTSCATKDFISYVSFRDDALPPIYHIFRSLKQILLFAVRFQAVFVLGLKTLNEAKLSSCEPFIASFWWRPHICNLLSMYWR